MNLLPFSTFFVPIIGHLSGPGSFVVSYSYSTPNFSLSLSIPGQNSAQADAFSQLYQQQAAQWFSYVADVDRKVLTFDRRTFVSASVVTRMNQLQPLASKYPAIRLLHESSFQKYKQLENITSQMANSMGLPVSQKDGILRNLNEQQKQVVESALVDYHRAQDLIELVETKDQIIRDAANELRNKKSIPAADQVRLEYLKNQIKFCEAQIKKFSDSKYEANGLTQLARSEKLRNYLVIAESVNMINKIMHTTVTMLTPDGPTKSILGVTAPMFEKYVDEAVINGTSYATAASKAFEAGYHAVRNEQLLGINDKIKELAILPQLAYDISEQMKRWEAVDKYRNEAFKNYHQVIELADFGIKLNQTCIEKSIKETSKILDAAIVSRLNKPLAP